MGYTVKQVAALSGVSIRTLRFYDEIGLLKPARYRQNGYRIYQEEHLLTLQQILFYRELGFALKQIQEILARADFEKLAALQSHRKVLDQNLARTRALIETIDKTIQHLKGTEKMEDREMFIGFSVGAGQSRFDERIRLDGEPVDCKLSARDTGGAMCVFEFTGKSGGPRHLHHEQDEWIYVVDGEFDFHIAGKSLRVGAGESVFVPRNTAHFWEVTGDRPGTIIDAYQPAGKMEDFFREVGKYDGGEKIHEVLTLDQLRRLFQDHGMKLLPPLRPEEWHVDKDGRITRSA